MKTLSHPISALRARVAALLAALTLLVHTPASAISLSIFETVSETIGSTAIITGSGSSSNTNYWTTGVVGSFIMEDDNLPGSYYGMTVSVSAPTGELFINTDSLMVARTVNSQGLTDNGTLSLYVRPTGTNTADGAPSVTGNWSLTVTYSFYEVTGGPGSFTITSTPATLGLQLTSLDIDFNQRYFTSNSDFTSNFTYSPTNITSLGTNTSAIGGTGYSGFTAAGDSTFNNPAHAVSSKGTDSTFTVQVAHNALALFMFEFRDPSLIVPEPASALLALGGLAVLLGRRRRA
jgi:hypothetical protein